MAKKRRTMPPGTTPPPEREDPDVREALEISLEIVRVIEEEVPDRAKTEVNPEYFESVEETARDIGEKVRARGEVTPKQLAYLKNMLNGVLRWTKDGRER